MPSTTEKLRNFEGDLIAERDRLRVALDEIRGRMGACVIQRAPSDDAIIFDHITAAERIASDALTHHPQDKRVSERGKD